MSEMIIGRRKVVLFPVETTVRELDFRLVLGCMVARADNQVILGNHTDIYELGKRLRHALYVGKNLLNVSPSRLTECYEDFKRVQGRMIHLDEEGAIFNGDEASWKKVLSMRLDPAWIRAEDYLCTWGDFQREHYMEGNPPVAPHILVTGHPRLNLAHDYYRSLYEKEVEQLRAEHGRIILINTNFSYGNHALYPAAMLRQKNVAAENRELRNYYLDFYAYCAGKLPIFLQLAARLSDAFPEHTVVFRPHPSESLTIYQAMAAHIPRMKVETGGSLVAWLRAAEVLIHSGCTTAVEARIAGTRIINFQPLPGQAFVQQIPDLIGERAVYCDEVVEMISSVKTERAPTDHAPEIKARIKRVLHNIDQSDEAFLVLRDLIWKVQDEQPATEVAGEIGSFTRRGTQEKMKRFFRTILPWKWEHMDNAKAYRRRRFEDLTPRLIEPKLAAINQLLGTRVHARYHSTRVLTLVAES
jgi:surface carbohydrate biosynthesis protein